MAKAQYSREQLQRLRKSPLVHRPEDLPPIEQWIEQNSEQSQRRPRPQSGIQNVKEENGQPPKRPTLSEARSSTRHSYQGSGEDIFLGPRISFASASAARQTNKNAPVDDRAAQPSTDDSRIRPDRAQGRERGFRDREVREDNNDSFRPRSDRTNGLQEDGTYQEARNQGGPRRLTDNYGRPRPRVEDTEEPGIEDTDVKRGYGPRTRSDQPWSREMKTEPKEHDNLESIMSEKSWRGGDRQTNREWTRGVPREQEPQWLSDGNGADTGLHTMQDFQKWKESMKGGTKGEDRHMIIEEDSNEPEGPMDMPTPPREKSGDNAAPIDMFKGWTAPKLDENLPGLGTAASKASSKPKASRFAGFFAPAQSEPDVPPIAIQLDNESEPVRSPVEHTPPKITSTADQEGFARMMNMLRMNNTSQGGLSNILAGLNSDKQQKHSRASPVDVEPARMSQRESITSPLHAMGPQPPLQQPQAAKPIARPEPVSRDSEFLLKLMQQQYQQPKSPFTEGQIYGQSYNRKDSADLSSLLSSYTPRPASQQVSQHQVQSQAQAQPQSSQTQQPRMQVAPPQQSQPQASKPRGAPPDFNPNERAYRANQQVEAMMQEQNAMPPAEGRLGAMPQRHMPQDPRYHQMQMPPFDQQPHIQSNRGPESIQAPPGFTPQHGPAPPGFFPFSVGSSTGGPQVMRQPMPPLPLPNFFNGPGGPVPGMPQPPGYGPPLQTQQPQQQSRRMSQLQSPLQMMPPGFDGMGQAPPRRPPGMMPPGMGPPPQQNQYSQYLKQGGGVGY